MSHDAKFIQALFDALPGLACAFEDSGKFIYWNSGWQRLLDLRDIDMSEATVLDIVAPEHLQRFEEAMRLVLAGQEVSLACTLIHGPCELPVHVTGVLAKIDGRKVVLGQAQAVAGVPGNGDCIRQSEGMYREVFNSTDDAMVIHRSDGSILDVNEAWCKLNRLERQAVVGLNAGQLMMAAPPYSAAEAIEKVTLAVREGPQVFEWLSMRNDGTTFWSEVSLRATEIAGEQRLIAVARDISERKLAENERARLEESLRQAQKMESVGRLAGGVAHDFNNLLTAISGNLSLAMLRGAADPETLELLGEASKAAATAAKVTRQLLAFSRKQVVQPKVLCLNDTISELQKILRRLVGEDISLNIVLRNELGHVNIDEGQIEQVVINLAVNSRDAMRDGGKLTIETDNIVLDEAFCRQQEQLQPGPFVVLSVSDNGEGMSHDVMSHLFEPFFTTKGVGKGTGLGLPMAYGTVRQNRGHITVDSELGRGTTVRLYFPRVDSVDQTAQPERGVTPTKAVEAIFVVEDEEQVRTLAVRILERQGYVVRAFGNAEDALLALVQWSQPVNLLISDIVMPGMNGLVLAARVRQLRPTIRVLLTSGYTEDAIAHRGVLDTDVDFLAKPYSVESLSRYVREILDKPERAI